MGLASNEAEWTEMPKGIASLKSRFTPIHITCPLGYMLRCASRH